MGQRGIGSNPMLLNHSWKIELSMSSFSYESFNLKSHCSA